MTVVYKKENLHYLHLYHQNFELRLFVVVCIFFSKFTSALLICLYLMNVIFPGIIQKSWHDAKRVLCSSYEVVIKFFPVNIEQLLCHFVIA